VDAAEGGQDRLGPRPRGLGAVPEGMIRRSGVSTTLTTALPVPRQPLIEKVAECDVRPGCRVIPHLRTQPVANQHHCAFSVGQPAERELPTGQRVVPGRDADLVGVVPLVDAGQVLRRLLPTCHNGSVERANRQSDGQRSSYLFFFHRFDLARDSAPPGTRTPNPLTLAPLLWLVVDSIDYLRYS
jgi:hypothetical protein